MGRAAAHRGFALGAMMPSLEPLPPIDDESLRVTAYHEAGHAVAQMAFANDETGIGQFYRVHIFPENHRPGDLRQPFVDSRGRKDFVLGIVEGPALYNPLGLPGSPQVKSLLSAMEPTQHESLRQAWLQQMRNQIIVDMAGPAAELELGFPGESLRRVFDILMMADTGDRQTASHAMEDYSDLTGQDPWRQLTYQAIRLVRANWKGVTALAGKLLEHHSLGYHDARAIVGPISPWAP